MTKSEKVRKVAELLRSKFNILGGVSNLELVVLAAEIVEALDE